MKEINTSKEKMIEIITEMDILFSMLHNKYFIIQPFLNFYKKYGSDILNIKEENKKNNKTENKEKE